MSLGSKQLLSANPCVHCLLFPGWSCKNKGDHYLAQPMLYMCILHPRGSAVDIMLVSCDTALECFYGYQTCSSLTLLAMSPILLTDLCCLPQAGKSPAYEAAMNHYRDCVRSMLLRNSGYECQVQQQAAFLSWESGSESQTLQLDCRLLVRS